ncbi:glycosyltransferase family 2 protein [Mycetocola sp. 2940]|uniref:glycosyltransferase family 2 protein n=1 Tax=Mycetocola sp. 2940 TaxID=3156452 RepID=UPI003399F836
MTANRGIPVTVMVQTKNEEVGLRACLAGLRDFDEVVVIDSNSTDATVDIAQGMDATVVNFTWNGKYPKKKQWQLQNVETKHAWVLFMDADETPSTELINELRSLHLERPTTAAAYDIRLDYVFAGRVLRHGHRVVKRALVHRDRVRFPIVDDLDAPGMGELEGHYQPEASGPVKSLRGRITHDDKDPVRTWFDRHNRYSDWEAFLRLRPDSREEIAQRRSKQGKLFDLVPFKPAIFFGYSFIMRAGFLDGRAGLDYALALSMYYWQIGLKTRELDRNTRLSCVLGKSESP